MTDDNLDDLCETTVSWAWDLARKLQGLGASAADIVAQLREVADVIEEDPVPRVETIRR
jgi:hypothetical protein